MAIAPNFLKNWKITFFGPLSIEDGLICNLLLSNLCILNCILIRGSLDKWTVHFTDSNFIIS